MKKEEVDGRIILIGTTATGLSDVRATPLEASVAGVEIHAQILESILTRRVLSEPGWGIGAELIGAMLLGFVIIAVAPMFSPIA